MSNCENHRYIEETVKSNCINLKSLDKRLSDLETQMAVFDIEFKNAIVELPKALKTVTSNIQIMQDDLNHNSYKLDAVIEDFKEFKKSSHTDIGNVKDKINEVDNKDKISILKFISNNFDKILGVIFIGYIIYQTFITN